MNEVCEFRRLVFGGVCLTLRAWNLGWWGSESGPSAAIGRPGKVLVSPLQQPVSDSVTDPIPVWGLSADPASPVGWVAKPAKLTTLASGTGV